MEDEASLFWEHYAERVQRLLCTQTPHTPPRKRLRQPHHVCQSGCRLIEERDPRPVLYLCQQSGHVHVCTSKLCHYTRDQTGPHSDNTVQMRVCTLTGCCFPPELHRGFGSQPVFRASDGGAYDTESDAGGDDGGDEGEADEDDTAVTRASGAQLLREDELDGTLMDAEPEDEELQRLEAVAKDDDDEPSRPRSLPAPSTERRKRRAPRQRLVQVSTTDPATQHVTTTTVTVNVQSLAGEKLAAQKRHAAFLTTVRDILTTPQHGVPHNDSVTEICRHLERVWNLIRQATNFASSATRLKPNLFALAVLYTMVKGLALPVGPGGAVLTLWPA
jgi:hypothetical protein